MAGKPSVQKLADNPPRWIKDESLKAYWRKWCLQHSYTNSQYGAAIAHFQNHAKAVVEGRSEPVQ